MASGDIINVSTVTTGTYQPAAGIEIIVLCPLCANSSFVGVTNGVQPMTIYYEYNIGGSPNMNKFGITNTFYYYTSDVTADSGLSGIQIK